MLPVPHSGSLTPNPGVPQPHRRHPCPPPPPPQAQLVISGLRNTQLDSSVTRASRLVGTLARMCSIAKVTKSYDSVHTCQSLAPQSDSNEGFPEDACNACVVQVELSQRQQILGHLGSHKYIMDVLKRLPLYSLGMHCAGLEFQGYTIGYKSKPVTYSRIISFVPT